MLGGRGETRATQLHSVFEAKRTFNAKEMLLTTTGRTVEALLLSSPLMEVEPRGVRGRVAHALHSRL